MTSLDCSPDVILLFVLMKYAKMSFFPLGYITVVGIQVEKPRGNPHDNYRGVPKGCVIKGCDKGGVIKGTCMCSYQGCRNPVFYSKYIINVIFISGDCCSRNIFINIYYSMNDIVKITMRKYF